MLYKRKVCRTMYIPLPHTHALCMFMYKHMEIKKDPFKLQSIQFQEYKVDFSNLG